ncbi:MAG: hypothetical protein AB7U82_27060 [Blastocatellales bacterium]
MKRAIAQTLLTFFLCLPALAQVAGVATLQGVVTDNSGAELANSAPHSVCLGVCVLDLFSNAYTDESKFNTKGQRVKGSKASWGFSRETFELLFLCPFVIPVH